MILKTSSSQQALTLLEVIITIALLSSLVFSISTLMRSSVDMRLGLSEQTQVVSRLNVATELIKKDLEQAYMLSVNTDKTTLTDGTTPTFFKVDAFNGVSRLEFTTMNGTQNQPILSGELIEVQYQIDKSRKFEDRMALYRGEKTVGMNNDIIPIPVVEGIFGFDLMMWNGESWIEDWDTSKDSFQQSIPHLVRLTVKAYLRDPSEIEEDNLIESTDPHEQRRTIVYLSWAQRFPELKDKPSTLKF